MAAEIRYANRIGVAPGGLKGLRLLLVSQVNFVYIYIYTHIISVPRQEIVKGENKKLVQFTKIRAHFLQI